MKSSVLKASASLAGLAAALFASCGATVRAAEDAVVIGAWCDSSVSQPCDAAFRVDLATGRRTMISAYSKEDFSRDETETANDTLSAASRNRSATGWNSVAITSSGKIFVMAYQHRDPALSDSLYSIDPSSGARQLLSPLTDAAFGPVIGSGGTLFTRLTATENGRLLVHHRVAGADPIISVDTETGRRSLFSNPTLASQGPTFNYFLGTDPNGRLFVMDTGNSSSESLMALDPTSGIRSLIAQVPAQNPDPNPMPAFSCGSGSDIPESGLKDTSDRLYCSEQLNGSDRRFSLDIVNTGTGQRSVLSDFGDPGQGPLVGMPRGQTWGPDGKLFLLDDGNVNTEGLGGIQAIDPATGARTLISNFGDSGQGPLIYSAKSFAIGTLSTSAAPGTPSRPAGPIAVGGLSQSESADPVQVNQLYTYTVSFTNTGATEATRVRLTDILPRKSRLAAATASQGACKGKSKVVCNFGTVAAGATVTAEISLSIRKAGSYRNKARLTYKASTGGSRKKRLYKAVASEATTVIR